MARSFRGGPAFGLVAALGVVLILAGAGGGASGGLVAAWGFDETSGATTADLSGNGNTGTISGATRAAAGRFGGALSFDGSNDSVNVADSASLDLTAGMTLEAWVRPNTLGTKWRTLLAKEQAGRLAYALYANRNTGRPWAEIYAGGAVRGLAGTGQLPIGQWTHLAVTYDGATLRLYVNGTPVASTAYPGSIVVSTGLLRIGGNSIWGEWFEGLIDEVRVYNRALAVDEIQRDLATSVGSPDSTPPSTPSALSVTAARSSLATTWNASTDDLAVAGYSVYRDAAKVATTADTAHTFSPVNCSTGYQLGVEAFDAAGNVSTRATLSASTLACDTSPPQVSLSAPAVGATVAGTVGVAADAFDDDGIAGVQFTLDGNPLGSEDVQPPYALDWNTRTSPKGAHVLGATARDPSGNRADAAAIGVNVDNGDAPPPGLVAAYAFEDGLGSSIADSSGKANVGTLSGPAWTTAGRFRSALSFDGVNDRINVPDASSLDVTAGATVEAWVFPTALGTGWRTVAGKERSGGVVYVLYANRNTGVPAAQVYAGGAVRTVNGTARLPLNTWSHLALTYDGTTLRLYVNGTLSASAPGGGAIAASTGLLRIGGNSIWGEWLAGRIDEVRVYDRALSEAELRSDMDVAIPSAPSMPSLTLVETEDDEHVSSQTIYYRPRTGGSGRFVVSGSSTDADTGIAKLAFPPVFGVDGGDDAVAPYEAAYVWADAATASGTKTVTAVNRAGLTSSSTFTVTPDMSAPSSGSITYADGYDGDGLVPLTRANGTDGLSGVDAASARVERQTATLAGGACGGFGAFGPAGSPDALATALCARYRARVSDNVGNEAVYTSTRVARVDLSPPVVALLAPAELTGGADQHYDTPSRTHYFRPTGGGSFSLGASSADAESGASPRFPDLSALTGWTGAGGSGSTYAWAAGAAEPGERQVVGTNGAGLSSAVSLTIAADSAPPAGGSIAYAGGYDADGTITVATTTGMDVGAGLDLASAALERQTAALAEGSCGELGAWQPVSSPDPVASGACARYRFRASDRVRNEGIHVGEIVKVDLTDPTDPALTLSESDPGGHVRDSTLYYRPGTSGNFAVAADSADPESGIGRALFPEVFGGDSGVDSEAPFEATYAWTSATTASGNPAVSMENGAGLASSAEVVVQPDGLAPEGGSVDYPEGDLEEGTPVTVSTEAGIDAGAGLDVASGVLERQTALGELGACSEFGPWEAASSPDTVVSGTCARYRYRVSDHVGNEAVYTSAKVVEVGIADTTPPDPPTLTVTETEPDEHVVGSTIFYNGSRGNAGSFTVSAEASDPESGIAQVIFPDVFGLDGASDTQPPYEREYSWNDRSTALGSFPVTVENRTGLTSSELFSVVRDEDGPDEVWVAYSGGYEAVPIVVETDVGFDLGAGLEPGSERLQRNSAPFGAGACGTFEDAWIDIVLVGGLDPSVLSDTCYRYRHSVSDKIGNVTTFMPKDVVKIDVTPPTPPTDVSVTATTETSVTVSWSPASDNGRVGGYALGRLGTTIANTWTTEYTFRNLACGMSYGVAVRAMDLARQFSEPVTLDVTTASCTVTPPPADVFLSPAGVDTNPCTAAEPCLTLGRGYRAAQPGQAVELASGLYAGQHSVLPDPTKTADTEVHFRPAPGAVAEIESLDVFGKHVSFSDLLVTRDFYVKCGAEDVTFRHSKAGIFFVTSASDVSLVDSEFGPYANGHSHIQQDGDPGCSRTSTNVLIDGVYFHDDYTVPHDSKHMECLTVQTAVGLTIRNSRFHRCEDFDVLFKKVENAADHRDVLIENTWFDEPYPDGTTTIQFSAPDSGATYTNVVLRHNSFGSQAILKPGFATFVDMRFLANVGTDASCLPSVRYDLNVWSDGGCGATDTVASMDYVDQAGFDFHLAPGAAAVNHGDPMDYPATDIDDEPRADGQPDAGADERQ